MQCDTVPSTSLLCQEQGTAAAFEYFVLLQTAAFACQAKDATGSA
jgi:hypothetical protein